MRGPIEALRDRRVMARVVELSGLSRDEVKVIFDAARYAAAGHEDVPEVDEHHMRAVMFALAKLTDQDPLEVWGRFTELQAMDA